MIGSAPPARTGGVFIARGTAGETRENASFHFLENCFILQKTAAHFAVLHIARGEKLCYDKIAKK